MTRKQTDKLIMDHAITLVSLPFQVTADIYDGRLLLARNTVALRTQLPGGPELIKDIEKLINEEKT